MKTKCPCGAEVEYSGSYMGDIARETGFYPVFNQRSGLTAVWVCPTCKVKLLRAARIICEIFGEDSSYMHLSNIVRLTETETASAVQETSEDRKHFVAWPDDTFTCQECSNEAGVDWGADETQVWEEFSDGWIAPVICRECQLSIAVYVNGVSGQASYTRNASTTVGGEEQ